VFFVRRLAVGNKAPAVADTPELTDEEKHKLAKVLIDQA